MTEWSGTRSAGLEQFGRFVEFAGREYAQLRNYDLGRGRHDHVSRLSPWLSCRLLRESEVVRAVIKRHGMDASDKFIQEVLWRTYWKGWLEMRPTVWDHYCRRRDSQLDHVNNDDDLKRRNDAAISAESGIDCFDEWVTELIATGYLHNHARMWFASIWIFTLKLPWELGADFFMRHLLDGDAASNTLSWRWVAGLQTQGKHYLARAENIAKFTRGRHTPSGLKESATALTFQTPPAPLPVVSDIATQSTEIDTKDTGLLVTDDDLQPESMFTIEAYRAALIMNSVADRSPGSMGDPSQRFLREAIADTENRIVQNNPSIEIARMTACGPGTTNTTTGRIENAPTPLGTDRALKEIVDWATKQSLTKIHCAYVSAGPARDRLRGLDSALDSHGIQLRFVQRDWDANAWPHATKGFFSFKKQIPQLLKQSGIL